jgi:lipoic acid synthetase
LRPVYVEDLVMEPAPPPDRRAPDPTREKGEAKLARLPVRVETPGSAPLRKPSWIRVRAPVGGAVERLKALLRRQGLHTVCEEASCPNLGECFAQGTATFLIMGDVCTRRCPFCDVAHGRPAPLDPDEPAHLATTVALMGLRYVVVTSVDRDDLRDGGAGHFGACIRAIRAAAPRVRVEVLVPDFRGRVGTALEALAASPADVFNHNLETVPSLYRSVRPGADYAGSLDLLRRFKALHPSVPTKSGLMLGLGETREEVGRVLVDLRAHRVDMLTLGQYLQPTRHHLRVQRFVPPEEFAEIGEEARRLGFRSVASGALVRSSYHAERQAAGEPPT